MKIILLYIVFINTITFFAYDIDKYNARKGRWRISEKILLLMGLCFGSVGQILGMKFFHHKTQKWYFKASAILFLILHIVILYKLYTIWICQ